MYRKFSAYYIFNGYEFLAQQVLITDNGGVIVDIVDDHEATGDIERFNGILCPGFINAHCHLELSHLKGRVPKHTGLVNFVLHVIGERHNHEDEIPGAIEKAEDEMLKNGIVGVGDICNNIHSIPQKCKNRLQYHNFIEASGFPPSVAKERFERAVHMYKNFEENFRTNSIVPHAPYSVSPELFEMINAVPGNDLLTIHNQETSAENEFFEKGKGELLALYQQMGIDISWFKPSGRSSIQTWYSHFTNKQAIILVHNLSTTAADLLYVKQVSENNQQPPFLCLCPNANTYISNSLPDVQMLMRHTDHIVLGTDSLASNDGLCILEEIKCLQNNFRELNLATLLQWATSNGSRALKMDNRLGSFEPGKIPGINLLEEVEGLTAVAKTTVKRIL